MGLRDEGKTILLASHNKEDIEILCDEVYEMDRGRLSETERGGGGGTCRNKAYQFRHRSLNCCNKTDRYCGSVAKGVDFWVSRTYTE